MILRTISKITTYFMIVFIMSDILILGNYFLRDYGEQSSSDEITKIDLVFFAITIVLIIANYFLKRFNRIEDKKVTDK